MIKQINAEDQPNQIADQPPNTALQALSDQNYQMLKGSSSILSQNQELEK